MKLDLGELAEAPAVVQLLEMWQNWDASDLQKIKTALLADVTLYDDAQALQEVVMSMNEDHSEGEADVRPPKRRKTRGGVKEAGGVAKVPQKQSQRLGKKKKSVFEDRINTSMEDVGKETIDDEPTEVSTAKPAGAELQIARPVLGHAFKRPVVQQLLQNNPIFQHNREILLVMKKVLRPAMRYDEYKTKVEARIAKRGIDVNSISVPERAELETELGADEGENNDVEVEPAMNIGQLVQLANAGLNAMNQPSSAAQIDREPTIQEMEDTRKTYLSEMRDLSVLDNGFAPTPEIAALRLHRIQWLAREAQELDRQIEERMRSATMPPPQFRPQ